MGRGGTDAAKEPKSQRTVPTQRLRSPPTSAGWQSLFITNASHLAKECRVRLVQAVHNELWHRSVSLAGTTHTNAQKHRVEEMMFKICGVTVHQIGGLARIHTLPH